MTKRQIGPPLALVTVTLATFGLARWHPFTPSVSAAPAIAGDPTHGRKVFVANCGACHTLADAGTSGTIGPNLDDSQPSDDLVVERVTNGQGAMPPFEDQLTEQQIADVAAYVSQDAGH